MKSILKKTICFVLALTVCLSFTGCLGRDEGFDLRCPLRKEPKVLDPQIAVGGEAATVIANCFEGLMRLDASGTVVPAMAESVQISTDGLTYTFKLREDSRWHLNSNHEDIFGENYETAIDTRVRAADFVFALKRALSPQTAAFDAAKLFMIKNAEAVHSGKKPISELGVKATSEYSVEIRLEYGGSDFLHSLTEPIAMPCCEAFFNATAGKYGLGESSIICNGPFYLSYWTKGTSILLRRNPDNGHFKAGPTSVTFAFTDDERLIADNLNEGYYAMAPLRHTDIENAESNGVKITQVENTVHSLVFNCADETVSSSKLRLALVRAMDFTEIRYAAQGASSTANCLIPPSCTVNGKSYVDISEPIGVLGQDKSLAKKYYDEHTASEKCELTILCSSEYEKAVRKVMQGWQQLFGVSFNARVEALEEKVLLERIESGEFQCAIAPMTTLASTPLEFMETFENGGGICRFKSEKLDDLISVLRKAGSAEDIVAKCTEAQLYLIRSGVLCPLFYAPSYYGETKSVTGTGCTHSGSVMLLYDAQPA